MVRPLPSIVLVASILAFVPAVGADARGADDLLARYRRVAAAGGWGELPRGAALRPGDEQTMVPALRARLAAEGAPLEPTSGNDRRYDQSLARAVQSFQRRHGLVADGIVGARTRAALDVPVAARIAQLDRARRHRARPAPRGRWIRVNIPSFSLAVVDGGTTVLEMPVVVGRPGRPTPVFESVVSSIVVNPPWSVPPDLAYLDLLPKIRRDPGYLAARRIDVWESWAPDARRLDPRQVDWRRIGPAMQDLALRQRPGPGNALGRFLIGMRDEHDVFLHDTPSRELFEEEQRAFSSGCIRVADARSLVAAILRSDPVWTPERVAAAVAEGETVTIAVRDPMPIRIVYETAWVDGQGAIHFRDDLYGGEVHRSARTPGPIAAAPPPEATTVSPPPATAAPEPAWPMARMRWPRPLPFAAGIVRDGRSGTGDRL